MERSCKDVGVIFQLRLEKKYQSDPTSIEPTLILTLVSILSINRSIYPGRLRTNWLSGVEANVVVLQIDPKATF